MSQTELTEFGTSELGTKSRTSDNKSRTDETRENEQETNESADTDESSVDIPDELFEDDSASHNCKCCGATVSEQFARVFGDNSDQAHRCLSCLEKQDSDIEADPAVDEEHRIESKGEKWKLQYGVAAGKEPRISLNTHRAGGGQ